MYKITCAYCGEEITFANQLEKPDTCPNCLSPIELTSTEGNLEEGETRNTEICSLSGLTLTYQKTNEQIFIPHCNEVILGREGHGHEIFSKVPQISRRHCKIEFIDNQYKITDLDSLNGTYLGISKIDCKLNPRQPLNDSELLFLGKEPFLIKLHYMDKRCIDESEETYERDQLPAIQKRKKIYRCLNCGYRYTEKKEICDECGSYDRWEEIES